MSQEPPTPPPQIKVVITAPCGHDIKQSKYAGTASWQNKWTCKVCGKDYSR